jgi:hypothetical protein
MRYGGFQVRTATTVAFAGLVAVLATACTDDGSLLILQAQALEVGCKLPVTLPGSTSMNPPLEHGRLDVALDRDYPYMLYPLVFNSLPKIGDKLDVEPNHVNVVGARVRIEAPPGVFVPWRADCPQEFDHPSLASLDPGTQGTLAVEAMRSCHAGIFRDMFRARLLNSSLSEIIFFRAVVRARGRHGNGEILSAPFEFPIQVCYGCLQTGFSGDFAQFNFPAVPACDKLGSHPYTGNPCNPAQDTGPLLCCAADADVTKLECPARPRLTTPTK